MPFSRYFKAKKTAIALSVLLCASLDFSISYANPASFNPATNLLTVDAVDVKTANGISSYQAVFKLEASQPYRLELVNATPVKRPGGNRAVFDSQTNTLTIPGIELGKQALSAQLQQVSGTTPLTFSVKQLDNFPSSKVFNRIASFPVYLNTNVDAPAVAEIVDVSKDGNTLIYTDGVGKKLGFVDIKQATDPKPLGAVDVGGESTSVAVVGEFALACVNTSASFVAPSGELQVYNIATRTKVATHSLGGQPDAVAVSPDGKFAAIVIENERDETLGKGEPPQAPSGFLMIVDLQGNPDQWKLRKVSLDGIATLFPNDAEPEYVDINNNNIAAVTLQENNHIVLVDLASGKIINHFSAGKTDTTKLDIKEEKPPIISLTGSEIQRAREPDGIAWLSNELFATANEGDLSGGNRGFTVFNTKGEVIHDAGNALEHATVRNGHYPESRSENKGNEPENIDYAQYGDDRYMFVASERASVIFVYRVTDKGYELTQTLPSALSPEGIKAIPQRNLLVSASELDDRAAGVRSGLTIYQLQHGPANYPVILSADRADGTPMPWAALSGLSLDRSSKNRAYVIPDSYFQQSRIYGVDLGRSPVILDKETLLKDDLGLLAAIAPKQVNADKTVNLDLEGISTSALGGFWLASEGAGTINDTAAPVTSQNLLVHATANGSIDKVVTLPASVNNRQARFGFEGVAAVGSQANEVLYVAFQREWLNDPINHVRIGRYDVASAQWSFYYYPLDAGETPATGGWVGLSEITALGTNEFAVIERDNKANTDARIKRIYRFSLAGLQPLADPAVGSTPAFPLITKKLVYDLIPELQATGGMVIEKIEGMTVSPEGDAFIVTDNDGVNGSNGETQGFRLPGLFK